MSDYIAYHDTCGLKAGDKVRVLRIAKDEEDGWDNFWIEDMDEYVGKTGEISYDGGRTGFWVIMDQDDEEWGFPFFVLEKVED